MTATTHATNAIAHFDIAGPDLDALADFYRDVLGWEPLPQGPGYTLLRTPDGGPNGALNEADAPAVTMGVAVDDLDQAIAAATARGGSLEMPRTDNGWVVKAQVRDPAGNLLNSHRPLTDARLNELLRALAHAERRRILQACFVHAQAAGDLAAASGLSAASVSEHLKVLRKTGLIVLERRGRFRLYRTAPACVLTVANSIEQLVTPAGPTTHREPPAG